MKEQSAVIRISSELSKKIDNLLPILKDPYGNPMFKNQREFADAAVRRLLKDIESEAKIVKKA